MEGAHDPSVHRSVPTFAAALAIGSVLASAGPAAADGPFVPGDTRTFQLQVPATWSAARQVDVTVASVTQLENGCLDPERKAGDDCLPDAGDLAGQLRGTVTLGLPDGEDCERGQNAELALSGTRTARLTASSPGVSCLFVELTFRHDALNNQAQSDSLTFGLDLVARELPTAEDQTDIPAGTDGSVPSDFPARGGSATDGGDTATNPRDDDQDFDGTGTASSDGVDQAADADVGALPAPAGRVGDPVDEVPEGSVLDRFQAQVSVGDDGVVVQTEAAESSVRGPLLAWGSLLLGAVALGWSAFVVVLRRRRKKVAA
jgi:hypothetical protein